MMLEAFAKIMDDVRFTVKIGLLRRSQKSLRAFVDAEPPPSVFSSEVVACLCERIEPYNKTRSPSESICLEQLRTTNFLCKDTLRGLCCHFEAWLTGVIHVSVLLDR